MAVLNERIRERREALGLSQADLAKLLGYSDRSTIAKIESGINDITQSKIEAFAQVLQTTPAYLMGWETIPKNSKRKGVVINVLGRVAAGVPIEAIENVIDTEEITEELARTGTFFGLQIHGNSMEPKMSEGDIVIVRQQDDAESGEIVIVTVNGTDATCKRLRKYRDGIELISNNPSYEPIFYTNEEIENKPVKIIGRVVELRAKF